MDYVVTKSRSGSQVELYRCQNHFDSFEYFMERINQYANKFGGLVGVERGENECRARFTDVTVYEFFKEYVL